VTQKISWQKISHIPQPHLPRREAAGGRFGIHKTFHPWKVHLTVNFCRREPR